jgi:hypothetical protein
MLLVILILQTLANAKVDFTKVPLSTTRTMAANLEMEDFLDERGLIDTDRFRPFHHCSVANEEEAT